MRQGCINLGKFKSSSIQANSLPISPQKDILGKLNVSTVYLLCPITLKGFEKNPKSRP